MKQTFLTEEAKRALVNAAGRSSKKFKKDVNQVLIQLRQHELMGQALMNAFYKGYHQCLVNLDAIIKSDDLQNPLKANIPNFNKIIKEQANAGDNKEQPGESGDSVQPSDIGVLPGEGNPEPQSADKSEGTSPSSKE